MTNRKGIIFAVSLIIITVGAIVSTFLIVRSIENSVPAEERIAGRAMDLLVDAERLQLQNLQAELDARLAAWKSLSELANRGGLSTKAACGPPVEVEAAGTPYAVGLAKLGLNARDFREYARWNAGEKNCFLAANVQRSFESGFVSELKTLPGVRSEYAVGIEAGHLVGVALTTADQAASQGSRYFYKLASRPSFSIDFPDSALHVYVALRDMAAKIIAACALRFDDVNATRSCVLGNADAGSAVAVLMLAPADTQQQNLFLFNGMPIDSGKVSAEQRAAARTNITAFLALETDAYIPFRSTVSGHPDTALVKFALEIPPKPAPSPPPPV